MNGTFPTLRRHRMIIASIAALGALVAATPAAHAASTCSFNGSTHVVTVKSSGSTATLRRSGDLLTLNGTTCAGSPTILSTRQVRLVGTDVLSETFVIDLAGGKFAPGYPGGELAGSVPEIEFVGIPGTGPDYLVVRGSNQSDVLTRGASGLALNTDADADLAVIGSFDGFYFLGNGGTDMLSGMGGKGTGSPTLEPLRIEGGSGNDWLYPGLHGSEVIMGGTGIDTVSYAGRAEVVRVTLERGFDDGGAGENDNVGAQAGDVENVIGGPYGDILVGSSANNTITPNAGADTVYGVGGNDRIEASGFIDGSDWMSGGDGYDTMTYAARIGNVHVALDGISNDGSPTAGEYDNVRSDFESIIGGTGNDQLFGNYLAQRLFGGLGNDRVMGAGGADQLLGGAGSDVLHADDLVAEVVDGGAGFDKAFVDAIDTLVGVEDPIVS